MAKGEWICRRNAREYLAVCACVGAGCKAVSMCVCVTKLKKGFCSR